MKMLKLNDLIRYLKGKCPHYLNASVVEVSPIGTLDVPISDDKSGEVSRCSVKGEVFVCRARLSDGREVFGTLGTIFPRKIIPYCDVFTKNDAPNPQMAANLHVYCNAVRCDRIFNKQGLEELANLLNIPKNLR